MRHLTAFFALLALVAGTALAPLRAADESAGRAAINDTELVATSDLIVVATVNKVKHLNGIPDWAAGEVTLKVFKTIKGKEQDWITVRHANSPKSAPGEVTADHSGMTFKAGDRRLFFLTAFLDSYLVVGESQGVRLESDADKYKDLIAKEPATITMEPLTGSATMGDLINVTLTITNNGKVGLNVFDPQLGGYFLAPDKKTPKYFMAHDDTVKAKASLGTVAPAGGKLTVTVQLKAALSAKDLNPRGADVPVRLRVLLKPLSRDKNDGFVVQTAPQAFEVKPAMATGTTKAQ